MVFADVGRGVGVAALAGMAIGGGEVGGDLRLFAQWILAFARMTVGGGGVGVDDGVAVRDGSWE